MPRYRLRDLLVVILVVAILLAVGLPLIQQAREKSRRISCGNNAKEIAIAIHNYHAAYNQIPSAMGGTADNGFRLSGLVGLSPFLAATPLWEEIATPMVVGSTTYPAMGPSPTDTNYPPWKEKVWIYYCPSDAGWDEAIGSGFGHTNYTFCIGDTVTNIHPPKSKNQTRGMSAPRIALQFRDVLDGLSNTVMVAEIGTARGRTKQGQFVVDAPPAVIDRPIDCLKSLDPNRPRFYQSDHKLSLLGRGGNWADGAAGHALVNTILPPNGPSCGTSTAPTDGLFSAGSYHVGGCHVVMGDGAVRFVSNTIDTGDLTAVPPKTVNDSDDHLIKSPFGVWGALGTRAGSEGDVGFD